MQSIGSFRLWRITAGGSGRASFPHRLYWMYWQIWMKIMFRAVESTAAKGYGGKKDYDNPNFRMQMASSAGAPIRSMIISGGMKGGVLPGMLEMANGHFFRGIWKMLTGGEKMPSLYACMMNLVFRCMAQDKPGHPHDYAAERKRND